MRSRSREASRLTCQYINRDDDSILEENEEEKMIIINAFVNEYGRHTMKIRDNGSGIDEEALGKIFIPFFTTKKQGSGIGLSLSKQIMRKHGGAIMVKSVINEGTEFTLRF